MRLQNAVHTTHPWRIHEVVRDFDLLDVWGLPVQGAAHDFDVLIALITSADPANAQSLPTRYLWRLRDSIGKWLALGRIAAPVDAAQGADRSHLPIPGTVERTVVTRLPSDLRDTAGDVRFAALPFVPLYRTDVEFAAEISNRTMHGVMHLGWVDKGQGIYEGRMAVYVKSRGRSGDIYLRLIEPFRHFIVYPALLRQIGRTWEARGPAS